MMSFQSDKMEVSVDDLNNWISTVACLLHGFDLKASVMPCYEDVGFSLSSRRLWTKLNLCVVWMADQWQHYGGSLWPRHSCQHIPKVKERQLVHPHLSLFALRFQIGDLKSDL